jgi:hypothetical protein
VSVGCYPYDVEVMDRMVAGSTERRQLEYGLTRYGAQWHIADPLAGGWLGLCGVRLLPRRREHDIPDDQVCSNCRYLKPRKT